jgi:hypothetical protein
MNVILHMNCSDTTKVDVSWKENYNQREYDYQIPKDTYFRLSITTYTKPFKSSKFTREESNLLKKCSLNEAQRYVEVALDHQQCT